jgi:PAS domain S-box-containing protein
VSKHRTDQGTPIGLFAEGGEAGGLVRAHDWAATPLGPPERWPHPLRTLVGVMLRSRQPMVVAWGPQHTMLYNDSYIPILGQRHPDALGRSFTDVWHDLSGDIGPLIDRALAGEAVWHEDLPLTLHRKGFDETAYFTFSYTPVHDEKGAVAGMFCACTETTGRVLFARRQAFRVELEGRLRGLADPGALAAAATRMLGPWLRTARVFYIEVEADDAHGTVTQNWNEPRVPDLMGRRFRLDDLGPALVRDLLAGRVAAIEDLASDPRTEGEGARFFASLGAAATIAVPVVQGGRTAAVLVVQHDAPRHWSPEEVDVACEVAGRTRHAAERSRTARALRASEARFRALVDASAQIVWTTDAAGRISEDSPSWREFTGQNPEEWHGGRWMEAIHPEDAPRVAREWADAVAARKPYSAEYRLRHAASGDTWRMTSARAVPLRSADGAVREWVGMNADISDLHRAGEALRRLNATLEQRVAEQTLERDRIWRSSQDAFVVAAPDGTCLSVSPAYERLLGWTEEEVLSTTFLARVHPDDAERARAELRKLAEGRPSQGFEVRKRHKQGGWRWIAWRAALDDGRIYAVARDVTVEKARAEEVAAVNRQLVAQIEERERVEETLRRMQRLEAVGQLTSGVAHDFNNLLTVILGNTAYARRGIAAAGLDGKLLERLEHVRTAAERGATLTAQLLAFSRRQRLEARPVDLNATVDAMRDLLQTSVGSRVRLRTELAADLRQALVDPTQIELVMLNLAINARDAMGGGGSLTVETANVRLGEPQRPEEPQAGEYVMVAVSDTGSGMAPEVAAKAFEPFFTTKPVGKGSGLGLAQVYGFAKQSGGGVSIETTPGRGTKVKVYLPGAHGSAMAAAGSAAAAAAGPNRGAASRDPDPVAARKASILLVDDDAAVREVTASALRDLGHLVGEAGGGPAALDLLNRPGQRIDLLVVDFAMPGMNGAEVARGAQNARPGLPVLFITGYADLSALAGTSEDRIAQKPFRGGELERKVARCLAAAPPSRGTAGRKTGADVAMPG